MLFNCRNGQRHLFRYLGHRFFLDTAQDEDSPALFGKAFENRLHPPQLVARAKLRLDVMARLQQFDFADRLERDDLVAPRLIDHEIARDGEKIGATVRHLAPIGVRVSAHQNFRNEVLMLLGIRRQPPQPRSQRGLMWQDDGLEPIELGANMFHERPPLPWPDDTLSLLLTLS